MAVDRMIRFAPRLDGGGASPVRAPEPAGATGLTCSRCSAVICEGARVKLFSGIVLRCTGCGEPNRVPRMV